MTQVAAAAGAVRRLVLLVAALSLLGSGVVELAPRSTAAAASALTGSAVGRSAPSRPAAESSAPSSALALRAAVAAAAPGAGTAAAPPPSSPLHAPQRISSRVPRQAAPSYVLAVPGGPTERGPPVQTGT